MSRAPAKRTGRRPGTTETRDQIAAAAQHLFAEVGYERATFRAIAAEAGVDPALVVHFFGSKEELFREVMQLPPAVAEALLGIADGPPDEVGRRLATVIVMGLENPATRPVVLGRIRSASSHPEAAALVRENLTQDMARLTSLITEDRADERAVLVGTVLVGVAIARYVVQVEPLASMPPARVIELIAPTLQRYLTEPLLPTG
jgi:AcrR family transcriptional regulator